jgi:hypothetical protein
MAPLLLSLLLQASGPAPCPPEGNAATSELQQLNVLMNRTDPPSDSDIDDTATLGALLEPGNDEDRWDNSNGAEVIGWVTEVRDTALGSADCGAARGTRIRLALLTTTLDAAHQLIAVVTPRWRRKMSERGVDWSTEGLSRLYLNQRVKVRGWLLLNISAEGRAINTAEDVGPDIRRATAWEIHPVTAIEAAPDVDP